MSTYSENKRYALSYFAMRRAIGWLGLLLPFILLIGNACVNYFDILNSKWFAHLCCEGGYKADGSWKGSISHYYYTTVGELFTGTLCAVALFLFCYSGHSKREGERGPSDNTLTNIAGLSALGVVIFPTGEENYKIISDNMRSFVSTETTGNIHLFCAALFFVSLAFMSLVNFRRSDDVTKFGTGYYDKRYLWCGITMIGCLILISLYVKFIQKNHPEIDKHYCPVFCLEALALIAFGFSWLTKGRSDLLQLPKKIKAKLNSLKQNKSS